MAPKTHSPELTLADETEQAPVPAKQAPVDVRSAGIAILAGAALIVLLRYMQDVLIPFVLSALIFYALDPVVDWVERRRMPRVLATTLVLVTLAGSAGIAVYSLTDEALNVVEQLPVAARKMRDSIRPTKNSGAIESVQEAAKEIDKTTAEVTPESPAPRGVTKVQVVEPGLSATSFVRSGSMGALAVAGQGVMIFFFSFFLLLANDLFKRKLVKNFGSKLSDKKITVQILDQIGSQIARFLLVQALTSAIVAAVTAVALWLLGLEHPVVWGIAAGVLNSIPYFGPVIVTAGLAIVAFMQFGTVQMAALLSGISLVITSLEGWLLTPVLLGRAAQMNHVAVFASLLFWSWVWGVWGMLLAVPVMMIVKSVCDHIEGLQPIADFLGE